MLVMKYKDKTVKALQILGFEYNLGDAWINYSVDWENKPIKKLEYLELLDSVYIDGVLVYECQKGLN